MISVIVPVGDFKPELNKIRHNFTTVETPIEVILVVRDQLKDQVAKTYPFEKVLIASQQGRGYALAQGLKEAQGEVILFLHADTLLPQHWDKTILQNLHQTEVAGGGFSLAFDREHRYLKFLVGASDLLFKMTGELWGDRALFVRASIIKGEESILQVPLLEDVRLSHWMKKKGKVVLLKEEVTTSAERFVTDGMLRHTWTIVVCRAWYALGGNTTNIYQRYYRGKLK